LSQQRLFEFRMGERSPAALTVSGANADAAKLLTDWRAWPEGALALVGPAGSGKTHLALAWALETGARAIAAHTSPSEAAETFLAAGARAWIDRADGRSDEAMLWRLLDLSRARAGALLLVGASEPRTWNVAVPDLRSRLAALAVARLGEPDAALLERVLRRQCRERFIELGQDALDYLIAHMPQSFAGARALADALDETVVRGARPVSLATAKRALAALHKHNAALGHTGARA